MLEGRPWQPPLALIICSNFRVSDLLALPPLIPDSIADLRYATHNNICGRPLCEATDPCLQPAAAEALQRAADDLRAGGYRLVIWDAYRLPQVQAMLRSTTSDDRYVAAVSNHVDGLAVDLTLADQAGSLLDMGTDFDEFSEAAHIDSIHITDEQRNNRKILQTALTRHGFTVWPYEWWHFDYPTA